MFLLADTHQRPCWVDSGRSPILERMGLHPAKQDGPVVVEVPPTVPGASFFGTIEDAWYVALVDIGFEGKGGNYLTLPPDYTGDVPRLLLGRPLAQTLREGTMGRNRQ
jgi:hypothetical protein